MEFMASVRLKLSQRPKLTLNTWHHTVLDTPPLLLIPATDMDTLLPTDMVSVITDTPELDMASVRPNLSQKLMPNTRHHTVLDTPPPLLTPTTDMATLLPTDMVSVTTDTPPLDMDSITTDIPDSDIISKISSQIMAGILNDQAQCIKLPLEVFSVLTQRNLHYLGKL